MKNQRTQTQRILDCFVATIILVIAGTLVASGIAISKINTDYMETGVRAGKIVAERTAQQISVTTHDGLTISGKPDTEKFIRSLAYLPPPVNTTYMIVTDLIEMLEKQ